MRARLTGRKAAGQVGGAAKAPPGAPLTVSQLTSLIESAIKSGVPAAVAVRGEISNCNLHRASGHLYFTMKDSGACIDCVMFRDSAARLKFNVNDGMEMIAGGRVAVYAARGKYQLYVTTLEPVGQGSLELAFRQLQAKLAAEGLFEAARKKPIPAYPRRIAMVTSQSTAALQDMLKVLRRFAWLKLMLYHVPVQGEGAGEKIAAAIGHLNETAAVSGIEVILLGRGGGSLEDLWAFNEEGVARAVAASRIPIVTGIGHEVDCTIADLVADHHAHTPTEAAQVVTANWRQAAEAIDMLGLRLRRAAQQTLADSRQRLGNIERHEEFRRPLDRVNSLRQLLDDRQRSLLLAVSRRSQIVQRRLYDLEGRLRGAGPMSLVGRQRQRLMDLDARLSRSMRERMHAAETRLSNAAAALEQRHPRHAISLGTEKLGWLRSRLEQAMRQACKTAAAAVDTRQRQLQALGPEQVLHRGYSITSLKKTGQIVRSVEQVKAGDRLLTRLADGEAESIAQDRRQLNLFE